MKRKHVLANAIICICLSMSAIVTTVTMREYHCLNEPMPAGVVSALLILWGGELLILAVRQIFGSDVIEKAKEPKRGKDSDATQAKHRNIFADAIIGVCLSMSAIITVNTMCEYHRLREVMPPGVVSALLLIWGGELLIVAARQIFGSNVIEQAKGTNPALPPHDDGESI